MRLAAIDIGNNAARLLIVDVTVKQQKTPEFNKINFIRLPLRLGFDVFETKKIGAQKLQKLTTTIQAFQQIMSFYDVSLFKVVASSAMRDAENSSDAVLEVERKTGIKIHVISGDEEALLVHNTHIAENMDRQHGYLYINVGGGSTDLIFFVDGELKYKRSFDIGTIRILKNFIQEVHWKAMKTELQQHVKSKLPIVAIGSGGNINKLFTLSGKKQGKPLSLAALERYYEEMGALSVEKRIDRYKLNESRADVIVPALQIYTNMMKWANINKIYVPKISLVDGLVYALYQEQFPPTSLINLTG